MVILDEISPFTEGQYKELLSCQRKDYGKWWPYQHEGRDIGVMKPILFNTEMVRAILDGRKTVTRRIVKPQPVLNGGFWELGGAGWSDTITSLTPIPCHSLYNRMPYKPDDIMYVRETWSTDISDMCYAQTGICPYESCDTANGRCFRDVYIYKASDDVPEYGIKWRPSIHMPKEAARIFLRVTNVRIEQLREIKERGPESAHEEGFLSDVMAPGGKSASRKFADLWDSTVKPSDRDRYGFDANPWVWVIEFERCAKSEVNMS